MYSLFNPWLWNTDWRYFDGTSNSISFKKTTKHYFAFILFGYERNGYYNAHEFCIEHGTLSQRKWIKRMMQIYGKVHRWTANRYVCQDDCIRNNPFEIKLNGVLKVTTPPKVI